MSYSMLPSTSFNIEPPPSYDSVMSSRNSIGARIRECVASLPACAAPQCTPRGVGSAKRCTAGVCAVFCCLFVVLPLSFTEPPIAPVSVLQPTATPTLTPPPSSHTQGGECAPRNAACESPTDCCEDKDDPSSMLLCAPTSIMSQLLRNAPPHACTLADAACVSVGAKCDAQAPSAAQCCAAEGGALTFCALENPDPGHDDLAASCAVCRDVGIECGSDAQCCPELTGRRCIGGAEGDTKDDAEGGAVCRAVPKARL